MRQQLGARLLEHLWLDGEHHGVGTGDRFTAGFRVHYDVERSQLLARRCEWLDDMAAQRRMFAAQSGQHRTRHVAAADKTNFLHRVILIAD